MKAIMGLVPLMSGVIRLNGVDISSLPAHKVPGHGVGYIPQGRRLFAELTVAQNLEIGLMVRKSGSDVLNGVLELFPRLRERMDQRAQTLSGANSRCWPRRVRCVWSRNSCCWMNRPKAYSPQ